MNDQQDDSDEDEPIEFQSELIQSSAFHGVGLNEFKILNEAYRDSSHQMFPGMFSFQFCFTLSLNIYVTAF